MKLIEKLKYERDVIKSEGYHYAVIILAIIVTLMFIYSFGSESRWENANANQTFEFNPQLPESKYVIPWMVKRIEMPNHSKEQEMYMNYGFALSKGNINFPYKMKAENGTLDPTRQSDCVDKKTGVREPSYGFCQMHMKWQSDKILDPRFKTDWMWQMQECYKLWKGGTPMYGKVTSKVIKSFKIL